MYDVQQNQLALTLDKVCINQNVLITGIHGGWGVRQRLNQLGVHVGSELRVIRAGKFGGALLIRTTESDIALGRGLASHIYVRMANGKE